MAHLKEKWTVIRKSKVFRKQVKGYLLVMLLAFTVMLALYGVSLKTVEDTVYRINKKSMEQLRYELDNDLNNAFSIMNTVYMNKESMRRLDNSYLSNSEKTMLHLRIHELLQGISGIEGAITDYGLYIPDSSAFISVYGMTTMDLWAEKLGGEYLGEDIISGIINQQRGIGYYMAGDFVLLYNKLYAPASKTVKGIAVVKLDMQLHSQLVGTEGEILIISDKEGIPVYVSDKAMPASLAQEAGTAENQHITYNQEGYIVLTIDSQALNWSYFYLAPVDQAGQPIYRLYTVMFICLIALFVIGTLVSGWQAWINYKPLRQLLDSLEPEEMGLNEYSALNNYIKSSREMNRDNLIRLSENAVSLREYLLIRVLKGTTMPAMSAVDMDELFEYYMVTPLGPALKLITISFNVLEDILLSDAFEETAAGEPVLESAVNKAAEAGIYMLEQKLKESFTEEIRVEHVLIDSYLCIILSCQEEILDDLVKDRLQAFRKSIEKRFAVDVPVGVSRWGNTAEQLPQLYLQCVETMEYVQLIGISDTVFYDQISIREDGMSDWFDNAEERIKNNISIQNFDTAKQLVQEYFDNMSSRHVPLQIQQCRFFGIINAVLTAFNKLGSSGKGRFAGELRLEEQLLACQSISDCKETVLSILDKADEMVTEEAVMEKKDLLQRIYKAIEEQYLDSSLSVNRIAQQLDMNVTYLSKFFKEEAGVGMLEYINRMRVEHGKKIMRLNSLSVGEVAKQSGFYNTLTFTRVFKKYEDMTPGQYNKMVNIEEDSYE